MTQPLLEEHLLVLFSLCVVFLLILLTHTRVLVPTSATIMSLSDLLLCVKVAGLCSFDLSKQPAISPLPPLFECFQLSVLAVTEHFPASSSSPAVFIN